MKQYKLYFDFITAKTYDPDHTDSEDRIENLFLLLTCDITRFSDRIRQRFLDTTWTQDFGQTRFLVSKNADDIAQKMMSLFSLLYKSDLYDGIEKDLIAVKSDPESVIDELERLVVSMSNASNQQTSLTEIRISDKTEVSVGSVIELMDTCRDIVAIVAQKAFRMPDADVSEFIHETRSHLTMFERDPAYHAMSDLVRYRYLRNFMKK